MILPILFFMVVAAHIGDHYNTKDIDTESARRPIERPIDRPIERPIDRLPCEDLDRLLAAGNLSAADEVRVEDRKIKDCPYLANW